MTGRKTRRVAVDAATRAQALQRAAEVGPAKAAEEFGLKASTLRAWRSRASSTATSGGTGIPRSSDRRAEREQTAESAAGVAREAIAAARRELREGRPGRAQQAMVSAGIALDKLVILEQRMEAAEAQDTRLREAEAKLIVSLVGVFMEGLGLPFRAGSPAAVLLAQMMRQGAAGEPMVASPADAEAARMEIRRHVGAELRAEIERELRERLDPEWIAEHRGLPAAGETEVRELEPLAPPRRVEAPAKRAEFVAPVGRRAAVCRVPSQASYSRSEFG